MQHELISLGCNEMLYAQHQQSLHQCLAYPIFCDPKSAGFHKLFKPSLNAVSVRRVLSKFISKLLCGAVSDFNLWYKKNKKKKNKIKNKIKNKNKQCNFSTTTSKRLLNE